MRQFVFLFFSISILCVISCTNKSMDNQRSNLRIHWKLDSNNYGNTDLCKSSLRIENVGTSDLSRAKWVIYFNFCRYIHPDKIAGDFIITHLNGDFFKLEPSTEFKGLKAGESAVITMISDYWAIKESDAPSGFYIVFENENGKELRPKIIGEPEIAPFINESQTKRSANDVLTIPTSELRYFENETFNQLHAEQILPIIPTPDSFLKKEGFYTLDASTKIYSEEIELGEYLNESIEAAFGNKLEFSSEPNADHQIKIINREDEDSQSEDYSLHISPNKIEITGSNRSGIFYGIQSLKALLPLEGNKEIKLSCMEINDHPGFEYRGLHIDVARNFKTKKGILKMLDLMAMYKLNKLHLHFCDDEGWRIEIPEIPELTQIGAFRSHSSDPSKMLPAYGSGPFISNIAGNGFYSQQDFIEILQFAAFRNIEVIPEIDVPGHARAAIKAMEARYENYIQKGDSIKAWEFLLTDYKDQSEYRSVQNFTDNVVNIGLESTYHFLETVVESLAYMYQAADVNLKTIHIGGDEVPSGVWAKSPDVQELIRKNQSLDNTHDLKAYFLKRISGILERHHIAVAGWEEIALTEEYSGNQHLKSVNPEFARQHFIPFIWNNMWGWGAEDLGYKIANAGYPIVLNSVTHLYFDMAYDKSPEEMGYYWGNFTDTRKAFEFTPYNILLCAGIDNMGHNINVNRYDNKFEHLSPSGKENILGMQGLIWTEVAKDQTKMEYMVFPKLLGLAERAWNPEPDWAKITNPTMRKQALEKEWAIFANTLGKRELKRLAAADVHFRIPLPGAVIKNGMLYANVKYSGLDIRYTTDGSEPDINSSIYDDPVPINGIIKLKAFDLKGRASRSAVIELD
ncbi:MAG: carbohydate-binding domain-containing protein [Bacteroidales bacterium]|nr:carbohydate-binding domain-containing protein [Bacteroidales bacterium]